MEPVLAETVTSVMRPYLTGLAKSSTLFTQIGLAVTLTGGSVPQGIFQSFPINVVYLPNEAVDLSPK